MPVSAEAEQDSDYNMHYEQQPYEYRHSIHRIYLRNHFLPEYYTISEKQKEDRPHGRSVVNYASVNLFAVLDEVFLSFGVPETIRLLDQTGEFSIHGIALSELLKIIDRR